MALLSNSVTDVPSGSASLNPTTMSSALSIPSKAAVNGATVTMSPARSRTTSVGVVRKLEDFEASVGALKGECGSSGKGGDAEGRDDSQGMCDERFFVQ